MNTLDILPETMNDGTNANIHPEHGRGLCRRDFLKAGALALAGCFVPGTLCAAVRGLQVKERALDLYNTHTGEHLKAVYWSDGRYLSSALSDINHILRDHRTEEIHPMDMDLLDLLHTIHQGACSGEPLHIISGYRSPFTNARLREHSGGVARNSLHMQAKAADIRLPGCTLPELRSIAMSLKAGGVGYYPGSDFIHVDVGRVRYW
jgi:uncharacterized protein YcbK (DUF882 family)